MTETLSVRELSVRFGRTAAVRGVSFDLAPGECLALVGESGSGKSVTARSLLGLAGGRAEVAADRLALGSEDLRRADERRWRRIRGRRIGLVLQDALVSLDPLRTVGAEIAEVLRTHRLATRAELTSRVYELLASTGISDPATVAARYPHQLSGGQRQRALIASALAGRPGLLIADEPTTALDVTVQAQLLTLLESLRDKGTGLLLISHDLAVVARIADRIAVMHDGRIVEQGPAPDVLDAPSHPYTSRLLTSAPTAPASGSAASASAPTAPAPASGSAASVTGSAALATGSAAPASGSAASASGSAGLVTGSVASATGSAARSHGPAVPASGPAVPASGSAASASGSVAPVTAPTVLASGSTAPASANGSAARPPGPAAPVTVPAATATGSAVPAPAPAPAARPAGPAGPAGPPVLSAEGLRLRYPGSGSDAVHGVGFEVAPGEALGLVGESGAGKSTVARIVLGLREPDAGTVRLAGRPWSPLPERARRPRRRALAAVFQDPLSSFDPRYPVRRIIAEALPATTRAQRRTRVAELLAEVGLDAGVLSRRPLELSGGQRQRVAIARALASAPELLVCDEPVSALDVSLQAQILDLLARIRAERGLAMLFVSHDLAVIRQVCDRVAVMKDGAIVESGRTTDVFDTPAHPFTRQLLTAAPRLRPRGSRTPPDPEAAAAPPGSGGLKG
ncbi:ABC transporter ATP-binding protein [Streptomyces sp. NPDC048106]|uniref:ABC transporter ATP-binding protein n=1 Tax=Streptomyces sp. NPDC048106 TaxID=3155750 RepID=UPI0034534A71